MTQYPYQTVALKEENKEEAAKAGTTPQQQRHVKPKRRKDEDKTTNSRFSIDLPDVTCLVTPLCAPPVFCLTPTTREKNRCILI